MKHAYLIIAHNEFDILQRLLSELDDERNDIYIHFDGKLKSIPDVEVKRSRLYVLEKRIDVRWGTVKQIETELLLFEIASKNGPYAFYHLISGTHLPLKNQDCIHNFFDRHAGESVVRLWPSDPGDADFKLRRFHFGISHFQGPGKAEAFLTQRLWSLNMRFQKTFGIRHLQNEKFVKTDNWVSLSEDAVRYLAGHREEILKKYRFSFCGDEYFVASELRGKFPVFNFPNLLYVEFHGANPKTLTMEDLERLKQTDYFFARKFSLK